MKVGIVTVFNAVNYGSFLQAFCLQEVIKGLNNDVVMIRTSSLLYEKWRFITLFTYNPRKMKFKSKLAKGYFKLWKNFNVERNPLDLDILIVGSDEMWELNNITLKPLPQFFGVGIDASKKITYAVSSNSTVKKDVEKYDFAIKGITEFNNISVRDKSTYEAYKDFAKVDLCYCLDPTLLVDLKKYAIKTTYNNYILCYTYTFEQYMIDAVRKLASKIGKRIIVVGQNFDWADECIPANAFEFLGLIMSADFVVTDTFHGATLSIGLKKQFVAFAYKTKVYRALELFDLLDRNADGMVNIESFYNQQISYDSIYKNKIDPLKKDSMKYLKDVLEVKKNV